MISNNNLIKVLKEPNRLHMLVSNNKQKQIIDQKLTVIVQVKFSLQYEIQKKEQLVLKMNSK